MHWAKEIPEKPSLSVWQSHHTLLFYSSIDQWSPSDPCRATELSERRFTLRLHMGNNLEIVQCALLNKLTCLGLLYFENGGQVEIIHWMLFFRNIGKEEGEATGRHSDNSSFMSMLVCLFFLSFSSCSFVRFIFFYLCVCVFCLCACCCLFVFSIK